jgi:hypothetical protein
MNSPWNMSDKESALASLASKRGELLQEAVRICIVTAGAIRYLQDHPDPAVVDDLYNSLCAAAMEFDEALRSTEHV